ncbi:MAG TPA: S26 family signal peptidase, partial [Pirellulaceae bacterium]|nr:S26 family signal peptidase [Pirellulaceae bacterium]
LAGLSAEEITAQRDRLISDFYAYNEHFLLYADQFEKLQRDLPEAEFAPEVRKRWTADDSPTPEGVLGKHWVGDLGLECEATLSSEQGELLLDLVEGGSHYSCRIDVATGLAQLSIDDGKTEFVGENGEKSQFPQAQTTLKGSGTYRLRLTNCDDQMLLWVNGRVASFNGPTTYANRANCVPQWSATDPGDLAPAGIGSKGAALTVRGLRIFRDVYYIASEGTPNDDYDLDYSARNNFETEIIRVFNDPQTWKTTALFGARRHVSVALGKDQFFPLGDNSPESADARSWNADPYVKREMLIGKALLIYWPHAWNRPVPFTPNIERMGVIH